MNIHSAKAKGRKLQVEVRNLLLEKTQKFGLVEGDIESVISGELGRDLRLSPAAEKIIPFDIECKNHQNFNRNLAIEQSISNTKQNRISLVVFRKNRSKKYVIIPRYELLTYLKSDILTDNFNCFSIDTKTFNTWKYIEKYEGMKKPFIIAFNKDGKMYFILELEKLLNIIYEK